MEDFNLNVLWWSPLWLVCLWIGLSFKVVFQQDLPIATLLGKDWKVLKSGLKFVPFGLTSILWENTVMEQRQFPTEPELVNRFDDKPIEGEQKRPIYIYHPPKEEALFYPLIVDVATVREGPKLTLSMIKAEDKDRYHGIMSDSFQLRLTSEASCTLSWHLGREEDKAFQFKNNVGSRERAWGILRDVAEGEMQTFLAQLTLSEAIRVKAIVSQIIHGNIETYAGEGIPNRVARDENTPKKEGIYGKPLGLFIDQFSILTLYSGRRTNESIADTSVAHEQLKQTNYKTKGEANRVTRVGKATAKAAEAFALVAKSDPNAMELRRLQVLEKGFENANLIVADSALGLVAAAKKALDKVENK